MTNLINCERRRAAVPRDLPLDGLAPADFARLATEGAYQLTEKKMGMFVGYRTYMVAGAVMVLAGMKWVGIEVPAEVWLVLNALGLGFLRAAMEEPK